MNTWIIILTLWIAIDIIRYIKYLFTYHRLNNHRPEYDTNHKNIKIMIDDLKKDPILLANTIMDVFYYKVRMEDMCFDDVCDALYELFSQDPQYRDDIRILVKGLQVREKRYNRLIFTSNVYHNRLRRTHNKLNSWFQILPIYLGTRGFGLVVTTYMKLLGYRCFIFKNGLKIWYSRYHNKKGVPLVFFHPSVGGVSLQFAVLKYFRNTHNIIMPEIPGISFSDLPGISFSNSPDHPPPISEIVNNVHTFITQHYLDESIAKVDHSKLKINLMGHSLGCSICASYINIYPKIVDNFFCVEGQIFFPRALRIFATFETHIGDLPSADLISVPLFHRELCVQYFMLKRMNLDFTCIYDMNNDDNKHIKIHMYHIKNDQRLLIKPQLEYAHKKNIPITYHLFDGDYMHGAFVLSSEFKKYVITDIQRVYDEQNHFGCDISTTSELLLIKNKIGL
jgi:pimeloyl-ACP methyl ester carboxylesterase